MHTGRQGGVRLAQEEQEEERLQPCRPAGGKSGVRHRGPGMRLDTDADTIYKAYSKRWEIEMVMRFYKSALEFDEDARA